MATAQSDQVTIVVDGKSAQVPKGVMLVEAAKVVGVEIPVFCYHPKLEPVGMCRMCLVEIGAPGKDRSTGEPILDEQGQPVIQWQPKLITACTTPVTDGMHVRTANQRVADAWRGTLEFLLTSHPLDCPVCDKGGECPLQDLTFAYGPDLSRFYRRNKFHFPKPIPLGELIWLDQERCIYCARCIRYCEEVANDPVLDFADRNRGQHIVTYSDPPFDSYFSGNTTDICPVGALTTEDFRFKARPWELRNTPSLCPHCPVGCNIVLGTRANEIKRIMPRHNEWVNELWICDKGRFGHHFVGAADRLKTPLIKGADGSFRRASWEEALTLIADRLAEITASHGAGAIGGIAGDRLPNEDLYLFQKFFRQVLGSPNLDHRVQWPVGTGIEAAVARVGLSGGSNLGALGKESVVLLLGADLEEEQPVAYLRLRKAARSGAQLIVAQSRTTKEMGEATQVLRYEPGSEAQVVAALLKSLFATEGAIDESFGGKKGLAGSEAIVAGVQALPVPVELARDAGLTADEVQAAAGTIARATQLVVMVGREALAGAGLNAPALVDGVVAILAATGKASRENSGLVALWPHNNSQGANDMGILPDFGPGYAALPEVGATIDQMLNGVAGLRAAYILGADPARDYPASRTTLQGLDFLVVQDLFLTGTAQMAHVVLPAQSFAERDGSFTNMERRVQRLAGGLQAPGESRPDWWVIAQLADRFDADWAIYASAEDIANELIKQVKLYKGLSYEKLEGEPVPWTSTAGGHHIYTGTSLMNSWFGHQWEVEAQARKPKFELRWSAPDAVAVAAKGQMRLVASRRLYDRGTMITHSELLDLRRARPYALLNPTDAGALGVTESDQVVVRTNGAGVTLPVRLDPHLVPGTIVIPADVDGADLNAVVAERVVEVRKV
ncbi:MAG TPA: NADH dehydrogenase (quinone) subunit G [Chloroflexi bacterium]|nr:NADH dehydrogenase (quinone) subunit G [Chloroflexota bacterium]